MPDYLDVPPVVLAELRLMCLGLPETYEEEAWAGIRWRIRKRTFAHVVTIDEGWPPVYARTAGATGVTTFVTFRSSGEELDVLTNAGHPFFRARWGPNVVGMLIDEGVDWTEVAELLTESYCIMAPKKLAALVDRPAG